MRQILAIFVLNSITFLIFDLKHRKIPRLSRRKYDESIMNYFVAGMLNQPDPAFNFLVDKVQAGITYCQYSQLGFNVSEYASTILSDIEINKFKFVKIFTISVGQEVAESLERLININHPDMDFEIISFNPCCGCEVLQNKFTRLRFLVKIIPLVVKLLLGWVSIIPMPIADQKCSLVLLFDQLKNIFTKRLSQSKATSHVVISEKDEFLNNDLVFLAYKETAVFHSVDTNHANTVDGGKEYLDAIRSINL